MKEILLFPFSGTAVEALDCLGSKWKCIGFVSDDASMVGQEKFGIKIFDRSAFERFPDAGVLAVHGSPQSFLKRSEILASLNLPAERFATVVHEKASVSAFAKVGINVLIMAGVVITPNAVVGDHVVILPNSVIHHDSTIGDFSLIAANATIAGNVSVGKNCYIGAASSIRNGVTISEKTLVGIAANVVQSYTQPCVLIGNPAKPKA